MAEQEIRKMNENKPSVRREQPLSDEVIIEIVQAFKDVIIEFINKRYNATR